MADIDYVEKIAALVKDAEDRGLAIVPVFSFDFYGLIEVARDVLDIREDKIADFINDKYMEFATMVERLQPGDMVICDGGFKVSYVNRDGVRIWQVEREEQNGKHRYNHDAEICGGQGIELRSWLCGREQRERQETDR